MLEVQSRSLNSSKCIETSGGFFPSRAFAGEKCFNLAGPANDLAHLRQRREFATGADLDQEIAQSGRFDWAGDDGALAGVGGELGEHPALRPAADNVNDLDAAG